MLFDLTLVLVSLFGAYSLSRLFMRDRSDLAIPLSPALLLSLWTLTIVAVVSRGVPLSAMWQPFWAVIAIATVAGGLLCIRDSPAHDLRFLLVPSVTASVVMAPD